MTHCPFVICVLQFLLFFLACSFVFFVAMLLAMRDVHPHCSGTCMSVAFTLDFYFDCHILGPQESKLTEDHAVRFVLCVLLTVVDSNRFMT